MPFRNDRTFDPARAAKLDDPARREWLPPDELIARLDLEPSMTVADVGAGTGYFALPVARAVAPGRLFAVDFEPKMLEVLRERARDAGLENLEVVSGSAHATTLLAASCDRMLLANVWHELDDREGAAAECARILARGGRLAILDWRTDVDRPPGPPFEHRVAPEMVRDLLEEKGWSVEPPVLVGRYNYLVIARPPTLQTLTN